MFGFGAKFADGDRYAALDAGGITFALAGAEEEVAMGRAAASVKVPDVAAAVRRGAWRDGGGRARAGSARGPGRRHGPVGQRPRRPRTGLRRHNDQSRTRRP
ncbi:hypothetical protein GCM10010472_65360 [Pseudonocardia halophobica]|uniref:Uncharacterized protein n=1 Tax=Pseudonocardia halophobica TaxID=29401 RepID=A0A9W6L6H8_9PSEU|nr:hypothetical protein GCM10017577_51320 [Pseudonocardia halophobica]